MGCVGGLCPASPLCLPAMGLPRAKERHTDFLTAQEPQPGASSHLGSLLTSTSPCHSPSSHWPLRFNARVFILQERPQRASQVTELSLVTQVTGS